MPIDKFSMEYEAQADYSIIFNYQFIKILE